MISMAIMSGLGFLFWVINARIYKVQEIGLATTLISIMGTISIYSLLGVDTTNIRFLSNSSRKNDKINTGIIIVGCSSFLLSFLFIIFLGILSPQLTFIRNSMLTSFLFIVFCMMASINMLTDSIFLAYRQTKFSLYINTTFSIIKIFLPFAFIRYGALGIYLAAAIAQSIGFLLSIAILMRKFDYRPMFVINTGFLKQFWKYSFGNYFTDLVGNSPMFVLPILIINHLGSDNVAYYNISMMIIGLLYVIPFSVNNALFSESSNNEVSTQANVQKSFRIIAYLLLPAIIILIIGGKYILIMFGKKYSTEGLVFLNIMAVSSISVAAYSIFGTLFRLSNNIKALFARNSSYAVVLIILTIILIPRGLTGIAFSLIGASLFSTLISYFLYKRRKILINKTIEPYVY